MMWHERWFPTFHWIHRWWGQRLTPAGRVLMIAFLMSLPGVFTEQRFATELFGGLSATFLIVAVASRRYQPRLNAWITLSEVAKCGEPLEIRLRLENRSARPCFEVQVAFEVQLAVGDDQTWECVENNIRPFSLRPGKTVDCQLVIRPLARGRHKAPNLLLITTYPLNLMHRRQRVQCDQEVIVTPSFHALENIDLNAGTASCLPAIQETAPREGESWEYYGSQEYREGMPVRRWDYGAWARLGKPYIREYEDQTQANAVLLLDLGESDRRTPIDTERAVSLVAALIDALAKNRWQIHYFAANRNDPWLQWEAGAAARDELMQRLATVEEINEPFGRCVETLGATALPLRELTTFVVFSDWDADRAEAFEQLAALSGDIRGFTPQEILCEAPQVVERFPTEILRADLGVVGVSDE